MSKKFNFATGLTHSGKFHADDVFATALCTILRPGFQASRSFKVPVGFDGIVYDIGLGEFDHHQKDNEVRANGVPYAAFGKLWRAFGSDLVDQELVDKLDEIFVQVIDKTDNTGEMNELSLAISSFNPVWDSSESSDSAFYCAVVFARQILRNKIESAKATQRAESIVHKAVDNMTEGICVLPCSCPWGSVLADVHEAKFVVYPSNRGGYNVQTIPTELGGTTGRVPFPEKWLGNPDKELGMTFCHPGNFLAATDTLENAVKVARIAINSQNTSFCEQYCGEHFYPGCGASCMGCVNNPDNLY